MTLRSFPLGRLPGAPALGNGKSASTRSIRGGGRLFPLLEKFLRPLGFIPIPKNPYLPLAWPAPKMTFCSATMSCWEKIRLLLQMLSEMLAVWVAGLERKQTK